MANVELKGFTALGRQIRYLYNCSISGGTIVANRSIVAHSEIGRVYQDAVVTHDSVYFTTSWVDASGKQHCELMRAPLDGGISKKLLEYAPTQKGPGLEIGGAAGSTRLYVSHRRDRKLWYVNGDDVSAVDLPSSWFGACATSYVVRNVGLIGSASGDAALNVSAPDNPADFLPVSSSKATGGAVYDFGFNIHVPMSDGYDMYALTPAGMHWWTISPSVQQALISPVQPYHFAQSPGIGYAFLRFVAAKNYAFYVASDGYGYWGYQRQAVKTKSRITGIINAVVSMVTNGGAIPAFIYANASFPYWCVLVTTSADFSAEHNVPTPQFAPTPGIMLSKDVVTSAIVAGTVDGVTTVLPLKTDPTGIPCTYAGLIWVPSQDKVVGIPYAAPWWYDPVVNPQGYGVVSMDNDAVIDIGSIPELHGAKMRRIIVAGRGLANATLSVLASDHSPVATARWDLAPRVIPSAQNKFDAANPTGHYIVVPMRGYRYKGEWLSLVLGDTAAWEIERIVVSFEPTDLDHRGDIAYGSFKRESNA